MLFSRVDKVARMSSVKKITPKKEKKTNKLIQRGGCWGASLKSEWNKVITAYVGRR